MGYTIFSWMSDDVQRGSFCLSQLVRSVAIMYKDMIIFLWPALHSQRYLIVKPLVVRKSQEGHCFGSKALSALTTRSVCLRITSLAAHQATIIELLVGYYLQLAAAENWKRRSHEWQSRKKPHLLRNPQYHIHSEFWCKIFCIMWFGAKYFESFWIGTKTSV